MKLIGGLVLFMITYIIHLIVTILLVSVVMIMIVWIQKLDGPAAALPALYVGFLLSVVLSLPLSLVSFAKMMRGK